MRGIMARVHAVSRGWKRPRVCWGLLLCVSALLAITGCASEERVKKANGYYQEGLAANMSGDRQRAFVSFQKAIQLNSEHKEAHHYLGHLYYLQAKSQKAEEEFREVLRIDPDSSEAHNFLGKVLEAQGRWTEAIASYRQALSNPLYATPDIAWFGLGGALAHEGDMEKAAQAFEDALRVSPASVPTAKIRLELGRAYRRLGYDGRAREELMKVISLDKDGQDAAEAKKLLEGLRQ